MNCLLKTRNGARKRSRCLTWLAGRVILSGLMLCGMMSPGNAQTFKQIKAFGVFTNPPGSEPQLPLTEGPDGTLYGVCPFTEGNYGGGLVFKVQPDGTGYTVLKAFTNSMDGAGPNGGLVLDGNTLYGTMSQYGSNGFGTVFKINTDGGGFSTIISFSSTDGWSPSGTLVLDGGFLYGISSHGGTNLNGSVFKVDTNGGNFAVLKSFSASGFDFNQFVYTNADGVGPNGGLTLNNGILYGTATSGGTNGGGTLFQLNENGSGFGIISYFSTSTGGPPGGGVVVDNGVVYGTYSSFSEPGGLFRVDITGSNFAILKGFTNQPATNLSSPTGKLLLNGTTLYGTCQSGGNVNGGVYQIQTDGSGYTVVTGFGGTNGAFPAAGVIMDGTTLYGTTFGGGDFNNGTVYKVDIGGGGFALLHSFGYSDAAIPKGGLAYDGRALYGTTSAGGTFGSGTVFTVNPDGSGYTLFTNFSRTNSSGWDPEGQLVLSGTTLYGTTVQGGTANAGTLYKVDTSGAGFTVLKNFTNATGPVGGMLLINGFLYGTTEFGGSNNMGTVYRVDTNGGGFTQLFEFGCTPFLEGLNPIGGLAYDGTSLYGTTMSGGASGQGVLFKLATNGATYSLIHQFSGNSDGSHPEADLLYFGGRLYGSTHGTANGGGTLFSSDTGGLNFLTIDTFQQLSSSTNVGGANPYGGLSIVSNAIYGTTTTGGPYNLGTLFKVSTNGSGFTVLQNFNGTNGATPMGDLVVGTNRIYGTTTRGGVLRDGTVFSLIFPPTLTIAPAGAGSAVLTWPDPGFSLQSAPEAVGVYSNIPGAASPYTTNTSSGRQFFRLIQ